MGEHIPEPAISALFLAVPDPAPSPPRDDDRLSVLLGIVARAAIARQRRAAFKVIEGEAV